MNAPPPRWRSDVAMRQLTSWRIGGPAAFLSRPADLAQLREDLTLARQRSLPVLALGGGSNLLVADTGYPGLMLRLPHTALRVRTRDGRTHARLAAGSPLAPVAQQLAEMGWGGLEWAAGIPGTVGGAIVNNAGAFGGSIDRVLASARLLAENGRITAWTGSRFDFAYRHSCLKGADPTRYLLLDADVQLRRAEPADLASRIRQDQTTRRERAPAAPSCGSVFRNPPGKVAGRLIAECGLSGERRGDAQISTRHANYILNLGAARADDVIALMRLCRRRVQEERGIGLELEVQLVGFPPGLSL